MRKTLSIILSVMMILSVCSFAIPASAAPEGTAINTADEFLAMVSTPADSAEITAKYYLAADITLPSSYAEPFWGILDGNGHTVTVSNPMFNDFSGEVKNLNIKGEITYIDANAAAFATLSAKGFNATNCKNDANVTITGNAKWAGGFVADCEYNDVPMVFTDCVNNGDIYVDSTADEKMRAGGFGGIIDSVIFYNCTNTGDIYMKGNICIAGGLVSRIGLHAAAYTAEAYNCTNTGKITVEDTHIGKDGVSFGTGGADAGGIFGHVGTSGQTGWYKIHGCTNTGDIDAPYRVGGMVGYVYASGTNAFVDIQFCINTGNITYGRTQRASDTTIIYDYASPWVAYTNSTATTIKYNINAGQLTQRAGTVSNLDKEGHSFVGCSSADTTIYDVQGNLDVYADQYFYYSHANPTSKEGAYIPNIHPIADTEGIIKISLEDLKSGKACYDANVAAANDLYGMAAEGFNFYQTLGTDDIPTVDSTHGWVNLVNGAYVNGEQEATTEAPVVTDPPADTDPEATDDPAATDAPEATDDPAATDAPTATDAPAATDAQGGEEKKGCGGFVAGGVALVAILGTALIAKKRD